MAGSFARFHTCGTSFCPFFEGCNGSRLRESKVFRLLKSCCESYSPNCARRSAPRKLPKRREAPKVRLPRTPLTTLKPSVAPNLTNRILLRPAAAKTALVKEDRSSLIPEGNGQSGRRARPGRPRRKRPTRPRLHPCRARIGNRRRLRRLT